MYFEASKSSFKMITTDAAASMNSSAPHLPVKGFSTSRCDINGMAMLWLVPTNG
jgi:hypothetical protein